MLINKYIASGEDTSKVLEAQLKIAMSGIDCSIERKRTIICGQLGYCVEIRIGKDNSKYVTTELNCDTGFGLFTTTLDDME